MSQNTNADALNDEKLDCEIKKANLAVISITS